uniref:Uncharacterized protein n=1 Tax=Meloidogyne enterolobii TaxID=390850 RepID=A0A6V7X890_MELEN|nr:unnamed protein product [Meloidogyne enterolobii]
MNNYIVILIFFLTFLSCAYSQGCCANTPPCCDVGCCGGSCCPGAPCCLKSLIDLLK